jgi:cytochrome c oxidase subunit IV
MSRALARAMQEVVVYLAHVAALFRPGVRVQPFRIHPGRVGSLQGWGDGDFRLLVEEGRRQLDRQRIDLDRIQTRSQLLFTTAGVLIALLVSESGVVHRHGLAVFVLWSLGLVLIVLGLLGAAALTAARGTFGMVDAALLSQEAPPVLRSVARAHAELVAEGENTVGTRLTVFRDAVMLVVVGAAFQAGVWLATFA